MSEVPTRYLSYVLKERYGTQADRCDIWEELKGRDPKRYGTGEWAAKTLNIGGGRHE